MRHGPSFVESIVEGNVIVTKTVMGQCMELQKHLILQSLYCC